MNAMTWYDHETRSVWSQPWGRAIKGTLKGVQLNLLPFHLTTWRTWKKAHSDTLVMIDDVDKLFSRQTFQPDFVIGLFLADQAKAYYHADARQAGVINDTLAEVPITIWGGEDTFYAYVRKAGGRELTFRGIGDLLLDEQTGSNWDPALGLAVAGPLKGETLQPVPSISSYDWAWMAFYPGSSFYQLEKD
jgi:hypothetical protein